jgi:hypothetical protein
MTVEFILRKTATLLITLWVSKPKWIANALMEKNGMRLMKTSACWKVPGSIFRGRRFMKPDLREILSISYGSNPNRKVDGRRTVLSIA